MKLPALFRLQGRRGKKEKKDTAKRGRRPAREAWEADPEAAARYLTGTLYAAYGSVMASQGHILEGVDTSANQRFQMCGQLCASFYQSGVEGLSSEQLQRFLSEGDLQEILWSFLCRESYARVLHRLEARLLRYAHMQQQQERGDTYDDTAPPLSQMRTIDGTPWSRTNARRAARRVGDQWHNARAMPER